MKKNDELSIYCNLDGNVFFDESISKFTLNFDDDQMEMLQYGLEHNLPVQAIAYTSVSALCMRVIMDFMLEGQKENIYHNMQRIDYWKTAMVFKDPEDCKSALTAMEYNVNIFKEFDDVTQIDSQTMQIIATAASCGYNACGDVKKGLSGQELYDYVGKKVDVKEKRRKRSNFFYLLRYPKAKETGLFN